MNNSDTARRYRYWRAHGLPAQRALAYVRTERRCAAILERLDAWQFAGGPWGTFAFADMPAGDDYRIRVSVGDDEPVDWGDIDPSAAERGNASSYFVAVQVLNDNLTELYADSIGGIDVIDLPGYLQRTWKDAVAYALDDYLLAGAERFAALETTERAHWEARDTITV